MTTIDLSLSDLPYGSVRSVVIIIGMPIFAYANVSNSEKREKTYIVLNVRNVF